MTLPSGYRKVMEARQKAESGGGAATTRPQGPSPGAARVKQALAACKAVAREVRWAGQRAVLVDPAAWRELLAAVKEL